MEISIITNSSADPVDAVVLASDALTDNSHSAPPSDVDVEAETTLQDSRIIGAGKRRLFNRKNVGGVLSFKVRPRYSSLANAVAGAWTIAQRAGLKGVLSVKAHGSNTNAADNVTETTTDGRLAIVKKAKVKQIGVTVEAQYEIWF